MELVFEVYKSTKKFPVEEKFGLISQINRCAISIPSNNAEGCGRSTNKDFANFLNYSLGSIYELETQIIISHKLEYINDLQYNLLIEIISNVEKMIVVFIKSLLS